jgi:gamma-glutamyltranspeptidase/glutathione hydrolase
LVEALVAAGHDIDLLSEPRSDVMGHAGAVVLHPNGTCEGGHDPRADGGAAGA